MKGITQTTVMVILTALTALGLIGAGMHHKNMARNAIIKEKTGMVAGRLAGDIQALKAYPNGGEAEVKFENSFNFSLSSISSKKYRVNVTYKDSSGFANVSMASGNLEIKDDGGLITDTDTYETLCLLKPGSSNQIFLKGGDC